MEDDVWLIPVAGGEPVILTHMPGREGNPKYSPDGSMIVFMSDPGEGVRTLFVISATGGKPVAIITHPGFSPDGSQIAFSSDRGGSPDIWVMEIDLESLKKALDIPHDLN